MAHIASAYYYSQFDKAMCISYDGYGDQLSGMFAVADVSGIQVLGELEVLNSLGLFYSMMTSYLGFTAGMDEYKVMGLAAYGNRGIDLSDVLTPTSEGYRFNKIY